MAKQLWGIAVILSIIAVATFGTLKVVEAQSQAKCHFEPGAASLVAEMLQETNLNVDDARAIANYMLAIRNGADPITAP